jgi:hypothetical protein
LKQTSPVSRVIRTALACAVLLFLAPAAEAADGGTPDRNPLPSRAGDFSLKVEPGVAVPALPPG